MRRPDITLSTGRVVKHTPMPNGATAADIDGPAGPEMTESEWQEYCKILIQSNNPNAGIVPAFPKGRW